MQSQNNKAFGQLSSAQNQRPHTLKPVKIILDTQEDTFGNDHTVTFNGGDVSVKQSGMYLIIAGPQIGKQSDDKPRWIDFWLRVNDVDVPNSNVRAIVKGAYEKDVVITQTVTYLKVGDTLNIMMSVETGEEGLGIEAIQPEGEPLVPSIILTILQLQ